MRARLPTIPEDNDTANVFQEIRLLSPRMKLFYLSAISGSLALIVFGICTLLLGGDASSSMMNSFGTDATSSLHEDDGITDDEAHSPSVTYNETSLIVTKNDPTEKNLFYPTSAPSNHPTQMISIPPTNYPSWIPSLTPSLNPSFMPSLAPSIYPTFSLSATPSSHPSSSPSLAPTAAPSTGPSLEPSNNPSYEPSPYPSEVPTNRQPSYAPTSSPFPNASGVPSPEPEFRTHDEPENPDSTYFNYDMKSIFGPSAWGNTTVANSTENYWYEFGFVENRCNAGGQSPIDLCTEPTRHCKEHHEFRAKRGDYSVDSELMEKHILHNKLRAFMARRTGEEPDPPHVDFAGVGSKALDMLHIDIKFKSEHTICGRHFDGEMQYYFFHPVRQAFIAISWLLEVRPENPDNDHLQLLIDEFQQVFDENENACTDGRNSTDSLPAENTTAGEIIEDNKQKRKYWDPFHSDIQKTIHFWGYTGSLTEPPCTDSVLWRIMDVPIQISSSQLSQMQNILFNNRNNETCGFTSSHYNGSVARPITGGLRYYKCTRTDYVSDDERELCGDEGCSPIPFGKNLEPYIASVVHVTGPPSFSPTLAPVFGATGSPTV